MNTCALILAAGEGTRMKSNHPKVIHKILERPMVNWVIGACKEAGVDNQVVVIGNGKEKVMDVINNEFSQGETFFVEQKERLGTGHAVIVAKNELEKLASNNVIVLSGDSPLIDASTVKSLIELREQEDAAVAVLTMLLDNPYGYGRVICDEQGSVLKIVEQDDATEEEQQVQRCNSAIYCFALEDLLAGLPKLDNNNAQNEYYLTDLVGIFNEMGKKVVAFDAENPDETLGVNSRSQLAVAANIMRDKINERHMAEGVTMIDPSQVWISHDVTIGKDTTLYPQTTLLGSTRVGENCQVGPNSRLIDTTVGNDCVLEETIALEVQIENRVNCGPRAYLRPGTHLMDDAKVGTCVEIKNAIVHENAKVPHLSYIGDATIGKDVNIGAGSITCNYDGVNKHRTTIKDGAFIGSDTMLVAPVTVGENAVTAAGSAISKDVPADALAVERAESRIVEGYAKRKASNQK